MPEKGAIAEATSSEAQQTVQICDRLQRFAPGVSAENIDLGAQGAHPSPMESRSSRPRRAHRSEWRRNQMFEI